MIAVSLEMSDEPKERGQRDSRDNFEHAYYIPSMIKEIAMKQTRTNSSLKNVFPLFTRFRFLMDLCLS